MKNIKELKQTDVLTYLSRTPHTSVHAITADEMDEVIAEQAFRILRPGGFLMVMSTPRRMYHDGAALLTQRFKIIDSIHWLQTDAPDNSFKVSYLVERMSYLNDETKEQVRQTVENLKIPKLRRSHIPIIVAQRPCFRTQTWNHYQQGVGLAQGVRTASGRTVGNVFETEWGTHPYYFLLPRIKQFEKDLFSRAWLHLIQQFTTDGKIILDITRGRHAVLPCLHLDRSYKTCLEPRQLEAFARRCCAFESMKEPEKKRWLMRFD